MKWKKLPIPYGYFLLAGIGLGVLMASKTVLPYLYWGEMEKYNWQYYAVPHLVNYIFWGLIMPIMYQLVCRYPWEKMRESKIRWRAIGASLILVICFEVITNAIILVPMNLLGIEEFNWDRFNYLLKIGLPSAMVNRLLEFWILYGLFAAYDYYNKYKTKEVELARMEGQLSSAQLNALRLQLQPHFLFNTLNTITSLIDINKKEAQRMISRLGSLLRTALGKDRENMVSLREELVFTKNYLDIEQARFSDRLNIQYAIEPDALDAQIPSLILQPLVENAIKHGFSNQIGSGTITLEASRTGERLQLRVQDDGQGSDLPAEQLLQTGIGLRNVQERLDLLYKKEATLDIVTDKNQGFEVILCLPFQVESVSS